jgi:hypothetical protein
MGQCQELTFIDRYETNGRLLIQKMTIRNVSTLALQIHKYGGDQQGFLDITEATKKIRLIH